MRQPSGGAARDEKVRKVLAPRSVAVVGATERPGPAKKVVDNLATCGFDGPVHRVNRSGSVVDGRAAYRSVSEIPEPPELVVVAVNSAASVAVVRGAADAGCSGAVLLASGFDETGSGGALLADEVSAAGDGLGIVGPNCLGFLNLVEGVAAYSGPLPEPVELGRLGLVSNSGAMACSLTGAAAERRISFSHIITTGNQLDLTVADFVSYLSGEPAVEVIACYLEGFQDGRALLKSFEQAAAAGKTVVVLKSGRSTAGGEAAKTHTGVLAGSAVVQSDLFASRGVLMATDPEEFLALIELACRTPRLGPATQIGAVTISGGERLLVADCAEELGLRLARLGPASFERISTVLPAYASVSNPLDTTGAGIVEGDVIAHEEAVRAVAGDLNVELLLCCQDAKNGWEEQELQSQLFYDAVRAADEAARASGVPLVVVSPSSGEVDRKSREYLASAGVPLLMGLKTGMSALAKYLGASPGRASAASPLDSSFGADLDGERLRLQEVIELLARHGVSFWPTRFSSSAEAAVAGANELGYPVVLKLEAGLAHRNAVDGLRIGLRSDDEVAAAYAELSAVADENGFEGYEMSLQQMAIGGDELFVGAALDEQFGPLVLLGAGGTDVERRQEMVVGLAPFDSSGADELVERACRALGFQRRIAGDPSIRREIAALLSCCSELISDQSVQAVDVNPLLVLRDSVAIVDAKVVVATT